MATCSNRPVAVDHLTGVVLQLLEATGHGRRHRRRLRSDRRRNETRTRSLARCQAIGAPRQDIAGVGSSDAQGLAWDRSGGLGRGTTRRPTCVSGSVQRTRQTTATRECVVYYFGPGQGGDADVERTTVGPGSSRNPTAAPRSHAITMRVSQLEGTQVQLASSSRSPEPTTAA